MINKRAKNDYKNALALLVNAAKKVVAAEENLLKSARQNQQAKPKKAIKREQQ